MFYFGPWITVIYIHLGVKKEASQSELLSSSRSSALLHGDHELITVAGIPPTLISARLKMNLLSLLLNEDSGEGDGRGDSVHLEGSPSSQSGNMLLRSHLILICHCAFAPCRPLASPEPPVA